MEKEIAWESTVDGTIFYDEDTMQEYIAEHVDIEDIEEAMQNFSLYDLYNHLDEEMKMEIFDLALQNVKENFILEIEEDDA